MKILNLKGKSIPHVLSFWILLLVIKYVPLYPLTIHLRNNGTKTTHTVPNSLLTMTIYLMNGKYCEWNKYQHEVSPPYRTTRFTMEASALSTLYGNDNNSPLTLNICQQIESMLPGILVMVGWHLLEV